MSYAHFTASRALGNSTRNASPIVLISLPRCRFRIGLISFLCSSTRASERLVPLTQGCVTNHVSENDRSESSLALRQRLLPSLLIRLGIKPFTKPKPKESLMSLHEES